MMTKSNLKRQKAAVGAGAAAGVGAAGVAHHNNQNKHHNEEKILIKTISTMTNQKVRKGGFMKILLPLIAAILILGAIAIFGGMALNNHNDSKSDDQK